MLHKISAAIGLIAVMGASGNTANAHTPTATLSKNKSVAIEQLVESEMIARGIPGLQIAIVRQNKIIFTGAYGHANIEKATPVTEHTTFAINSISKAFAGVAAMQLVEAGKLDLDAPLSTYLKTLPDSWSGITARHMLTHTSGLPEIVDDNMRLIDGAELHAAWAKVQALPVKFSPGEKFNYNQTNYAVLGKIIEQITGNSFGNFVRDRQFDKTGMKHTNFSDLTMAKPQTATIYTHLMLRIENMKTVGVDRSKDPFIRPEPWTEFMRPFGGIQSTATDLAKWTIALQKLKLVNKNGLEQLWAPQPLKDGSIRAFNATINGYGLGWPSIRRPEHPAMSPTGGARAAIFIYPKDDLTVIVLTNLLGASPEKFIDKIAGLYIAGLNSGSGK